MIGRYVRQVGLFSMAGIRIPLTQRSIPRRWASDDEKIGTISNTPDEKITADQSIRASLKRFIIDDNFVGYRSTLIALKKSSIDDHWQDIFKQGQICVEIIRTNYNELLANRSEFLLGWVEEMANSSDLSYTADAILRKERSIGGPHGNGPLMQEVDEWWRLKDELKIQSKLDEQTRMAIENLSLIANKLVDEIFNDKKSRFTF